MINLTIKNRIYHYFYLSIIGEIKMEEINKILKQEGSIDSRDFAKIFNKNHTIILEKIDNLKKRLKEIDKENQISKIFKEKTREYKGRTFRYVKMNKQAFALLTTTFKSKKGLKLQYDLFSSFFETKRNY